MTRRILSAAADELAAAITYYEKQSSGLGAIFLTDFEAAIQRILDTPNAWTKVSKHQRRKQMRRFPFAILYRHSGRDLTITAVADLRRDPARLKTRIRRT